jgi:hypothetical protein
MTPDNPGDASRAIRVFVFVLFPVALLFFRIPMSHSLFTGPSHAHVECQTDPKSPAAIGLFYPFFCLPGSGSGADEMCSTSSFVFPRPAEDCPEVSMSVGLSRIAHEQCQKSAGFCVASCVPPPGNTERLQREI